jgi:uncharacterized delta-60 repeat protein
MVNGSMTMHFGLAMLNPDGSLDQNFGFNGRVVTDLNALNAFTYSAGLTPDGKIIQVGYGVFASAAEIILVQYNQNGSLDLGFGNAGIHRIELPAANVAALDHVYQPDGKLLLTGLFDDGITWFMVMRLNQDASTDSTFGTDGIATAAYGVLGNYPWDIALQGDTGIVIVGTSEWPGNDKYTVVTRFDSSGVKDEDFGSTGFAVIDFGNQDNDGAALLVQDDGKILVAGNANTGGDEFFTLSRLNTDGTTDLTFGNLGHSACYFLLGDSYAQDMAMQADGKIVIAGRSNNGSDNDFAMVRYDQNGDLDPDFGDVGRVVTDFGNGTDQAHALLLQDDQLIVLAGSASNGSDSDFAAARYISGVDLSIGNVDAVIGSTFIYPNPVSDQTITLKYTLAETQDVSVLLYSVTGKLIGTLMSKRLRMNGAQTEQLTIPSGVPTGNYLVRVRTEKGEVTIRIVVDQL